MSLFCSNYPVCPFMSVFLLILEASKGKLKSLNVSIEYKCEISVSHIRVISLRFFISI